ncbi:nucleoside-diphosphate kinase [Listeria sp. PSOL-1]|uniref:nucleoside-diphosphate kinase n=1 Tax=Listeria sp. PSOL-1 TaxID=1844999 RepID=UPI0013CFD44D|nr:nucleoside-diphosphate kinase [Listeria sp. PSOL-1]
MERTYMMIKPDGVERGYIGEIISRFEKKGLKLVGAKMLQITPELAKAHYKEHAGKPFFNDLITFITSNPVFAMVLEGDHAIEFARKMMGKTNPEEASAGTIRFDYALHMNRNIIHGSDSQTSAEREIALFFNPEELVHYQKALDVWL